MSKHINTISVERNTDKIVNIRFANPPVNLIIPETVVSLHKTITDLCEDEKVHVVVFSSDVTDFFYNHFDLAQIKDFPNDLDANGGSLWTDLVIRLTKAPFISIGLIRGRTRGGGNELSMAMDLRYASIENAFFAQPEVGGGVIPGGGGTERLPQLIGRDRALEIILSSDDYNATIAEKWGLITKAVPDLELDNYVAEIANLLASFDKTALIAAKNQINRATLPNDKLLQMGYQGFMKSLHYPGFQPRTASFLNFLAKIGIHDIEKRLGHYIGLASKF